MVVHGQVGASVSYRGIRDLFQVITVGRKRCFHGHITVTDDVRDDTYRMQNIH